MSQEATYTCSACGVERISPGIGADPGERTPCPNEDCGSTDVTLAVAIHDKVGVREGYRMKLKNPEKGSRGRTLETKAGSEFFRRDGRWHRVWRRIDYVNDWYDEVITDEQTGAVVHECHEPLSAHQGRGSARPGGGGPPPH